VTTSTKGRVVLVTGGGRGIGHSIALAFAAEGDSVIVNDVPDVGASDTVSAIKAAGGKAIGVMTDISDQSQVQAMFEKVKNEVGPVGVVVNNAAYYDFINPTKQSVKSFEQTFSVDVTGTFHTIQAAVPHMKALGGGVVVNIASVNAYVTIPQNAAYSAAKAAVVGLTRAFALELGPLGIRVVSVSPGFTATPAVNLYLDSLSEEARKLEMGTYYDRLPLGRLAKPEEIADACVFLASERASFITGTDLLVDGGMFALNKVFSYNP
jgi:NAD(P)-dependent dehydrogenase (short-subunit alcohol dehydrogenase family)